MKLNQSQQIETALENVTITLSMLDTVARREQVPNRMEIPKAYERAQQRLEESYKHGDLIYADVQDIFSVAERAARHLWNPTRDDFLHRHAIQCVNTVANIEAQESLASSGLTDIPEQYQVTSLIELVKKTASTELESRDIDNRDARALIAGLSEAISIDGAKLRKGVAQQSNADKLPTSASQKIQQAAKLIDEVISEGDKRSGSDVETWMTALSDLNDKYLELVEGADRESASTRPS
jgi:hypothetical protein